MDSVTENIYKDMAYPLVEGTLEGLQRHHLRLRTDRMWEVVLHAGHPGSSHSAGVDTQGLRAYLRRHQHIDGNKISGEYLHK